MKSTFLAFLLIIQLCSFQCNAVVISVEAEQPVITKPRSSFEAVSSLTILTCFVGPSNSSFISRWITPSGEIISLSTGRYSLNQGLVSANRLGTVLAVQRLSYKDAGVYTCEAVPRGGSVSSCDCSGFPTSASIQLVLQVYLRVFVEEITVTEGTTVFLHCEMSGYILPDEDILWFKGEDVIRPVDRFSIAYSDGTANSAANGGVSTSFSRVSTLEIATTILSDAGVYVCRVRGREVFANVTLVVEEDTTLHTPGEPLEQTDTPISQGMWTTTASDNFQADNPPPLMEFENEDTSIAMNKCKLEQSRVIGVTFVVTFLVTVCVCVLLMVVVVFFLCMKLRRKNKQYMNKETDNASEDKEVLSAVNVHACVLDGLSVDTKN